MIISARKLANASVPLTTPPYLSSFPRRDCYALGRPIPFTPSLQWLPLGPGFVIPLNGNRENIFAKLVLGCSVPHRVCSPLGAFRNVFFLFSKTFCLYQNGFSVISGNKWSLICILSILNFSLRCFC